jgi:uncharacterized protein YbjT (DUF2867 family)
MSPRLALVTCATGNVGSKVIDHLLATGCNVRAGTRHPEKGQSRPGVEWVLFDYSDPTTMDPAMKGCDCVFLNMPPAYDKTLERLSMAIDRMKANGIGKVTFMTNLFTEANPASEHRKLELYLAGSGLRYTIVRPSFFMQNFLGQHGQTIKSDGAFYLPAGKGRIGFIDTRDIGEVCARSLTDGNLDGQTLLITGPELLDHDDVANILSRTLGRTIRYVDIPVEAYRGGLRSFGMPDHAVDFMVFLFDTAVRNNMAAVLTDEVKRVLGRPPRSFRQFVSDHTSHWSR